MFLNEAQFQLLLKEIKLSQLEIDLATDRALQTLNDRINESDSAEEAKTLLYKECKDKGLLSALEVPLRKHGELMHKLADQTAILNKHIIDWTKDV